MALLRISTATLLCVALLAGCDADRGPAHASFQHFEVNNDALVTVHSRTQSDATVNAAGDLTIAGKPVATTPAQRQLLQRYYTQVQGIRSDAIATGKQGVALAGRAISEVVGGLTSGDPNRIGERVEGEAKKVEASAVQICVRLGAIRNVQEALAADLAAFRPYATIRADQVSDCGDNKLTVRDATLIEPVDAAVDGGDAAVAGIDAAVGVVDTAIGGIDTVIDGIDAAIDGTDAVGDVDAVVLGDGTALIRAAARGDLAEVDQLIGLGANVNKAARGDGNPLIAAANRGHADIVARLVAAGADVNAVVPGDETPLINAARGGHLDVVTFLVEHGADVNKGVTADFGRWRSPLNQAANNQVRAYLTSKGAVADRKS